MPEIIYRPYYQGGVRYVDAVRSDGKEFKFDFEEGFYMQSPQIWGQLGVDTAFRPMNIVEIFGNNNPLYVEIGIGNGEFIAHHAMNNPDQNWLGFEVFHKIFAKAVSRCRKIPHRNMRLLQFDAELFVRMLPERSVTTFHVNFPDPWPKARHTKRRLLKAWFIEFLETRLVNGGNIIVATDHDDYAAEITENFSQVNTVESTLGKPYINNIGDYYQTKYYRKFAAQGTVYFYNMKTKRI